MYYVSVLSWHKETLKLLVVLTIIMIAICTSVPVCALCVFGMSVLEFTDIRQYKAMMAPGFPASFSGLTKGHCRMKLGSLGTRPE